MQCCKRKVRCFEEGVSFLRNTSSSKKVNNLFRRVDPSKLIDPPNLVDPSNTVDPSNLVDPSLQVEQSSKVSSSEFGHQ